VTTFWEAAGIALLVVACVGSCAVERHYSAMDCKSVGGVWTDPGGCSRGTCGERK
jgi:hypothetical protein